MIENDQKLYSSFEGMEFQRVSHNGAYCIWTTHIRKRIHTPIVLDWVTTEEDDQRLCVFTVPYKYVAYHNQ